MTSTRNNNTPSDYCLQQREYTLAGKYTTYEYSQYGHAYNPAIPCVGIMPTNISRDVYAKNYIEIESSLLGINSVNLVNPQPPVVPELKKISSVKFFDRIPIIMPKPLVIENNQRPFPIPN
jgi:hypothetical protein